MEITINHPNFCYTVDKGYFDLIELIAHLKKNNSEFEVHCGSKNGYRRSMNGKDMTKKHIRQYFIANWIAINVL